jgi:anti-sigma B factor antagonist
VSHQSLDLVVEHEQLADRTIIRVTGELDLHTCTMLHDELAKYVPYRSPVTFDMTAVGFIDSTGIRSLLTLNSDALGATGEPLRVEGASDASRRLFALTGIDRVLNVVST